MKGNNKNIVKRKNNSNAKKKVNEVNDEVMLKLKQKEEKLKLLENEIEKKEELLGKEIVEKKDDIKDNIYKTEKKVIKEVKKDTKKIEKKIDNKKKKDNRFYEKCSCYIVGVIILFLIYAVIKNSIFIPALLITIGLLLFCIAYYYINDNSKKSLVYGLFEFGVFLVIAAIIYTIVLTV